jgi:hypothetical protein
MGDQSFMQNICSIYLEELPFNFKQSIIGKKKSKTDFSGSIRVHIRALNNAQVVCDVGVGRCN